MSARIERTAVAARKPKNKAVVVKFASEQLKAPFLMRCGALILDYIIIVSVPVIGLLVSRYMGNDGAKLLNSRINQISLLIGLLLGITNFVIFPLFSGQSIGKMLTGIKIVKSDGNTVSFSRVLVRHLIGYPLTLLTFGLGFILSVFNRNGRSLHDYLAGTIVIHGRRRVLQKDSDV